MEKIAFVSLKIFLEKNKIPKRSFYRYKRKRKIFVVKLHQEFILVDENFKPINPKKIKEISENLIYL